MSKLGKSHNIKQGKIFVFEGPDGVGKSTIIHETKKKLIDEGFDVLNLSFPGKTQGTLGKLVYDIHHGNKDFSLNELPSSSLQILHIAAHIDCIENIIKPALSNGKIILISHQSVSGFLSEFGTII